MPKTEVVACFGLASVHHRRRPVEMGVVSRVGLRDIVRIYLAAKANTESSMQVHCDWGAVVVIAFSFGLGVP